MDHSESGAAGEPNADTENQQRGASRCERRDPGQGPARPCRPAIADANQHQPGCRERGGHAGSIGDHEQDAERSTSKAYGAQQHDEGRGAWNKPSGDTHPHQAELSRAAG